MLECYFTVAVYSGLLSISMIYIASVWPVSDFLSSDTYFRAGMRTDI